MFVCENKMHWHYFYLSESGIQYTREVYNIWDLIGDIAGIYELMVAFFGLILYSVAKNNFVVSAISKLFLINTKDPDLIKYSETNN